MDNHKNLNTMMLYKRPHKKSSKSREPSHNDSAEVKMFKENLKVEEISNPSADDKRPIVDKSALQRADPPSLVNIDYPTELVLRQLLPQLTKYFSLQDLLRCRLVCKTILEGIDSQFITNIELPNQSQVGGRYKVEPSLFFNCRLHTGATGPLMLEGIHVLDKLAAETFLVNMEDHPENPFVSRSVRFGNYSSNSNFSGYWESVVDILQRFGHHIWHVELSDGHDHISDHLTCYKVIQECLEHMPNLKSLELSFEIKEIPNEHEQQELLEFIQTYPLPLLECLEKLDWNDLKVSTSIAVALFRAYGDQLRAVGTSAKVLLSDSNATRLPNLWGLYLTKVFNNEVLLTLSNCELPNLRRLYIDLGGERCISCGDKSTEAWSVKGILYLVKRFGLEHLSVFFAPGCQLRGNNTLNVNEWSMDTLKLLEIQHYPDTNYEFLKCFPKLEHIHFFDIHHPMIPKRQPSRVDSAELEGIQEEPSTSTEEPPINEKIIIDRYLYTGKIYDSSIWYHLPRLQWVTFKCVWDRNGKHLIAVFDWYKREMYKVHRKRMDGTVAKIFDYVQSWFPIA